jgi:pimeloyl-ACP methyl ester carboxylesterase
MNLQPANSTTIAVAEGDSAPWLTMVHGATHNHRYFGSQVEAFRKDYRLLLIDLPGHGASAGLPGPYGFEEYADSVLAAMDAAGVEATHYIGTHTGSAVALILASRIPERFLSLALEGPPTPGVDLPSVIDSMARSRATAREHGVDAARREWYERSRWFDIIRAEPERCRADEHWDMLLEFGGAPWLDDKTPRPVSPVLERLTSIECPVLIINGEHDVEDFLQSADALEQRLPNTRRVRIAGAGGFPMWEDAETVNAHIRRHLDAQPRDQRRTQAMK